MKTKILGLVGLLLSVNSFSVYAEEAPKPQIIKDEEAKSLLEKPAFSYGAFMKQYWDTGKGDADIAAMHGRFDWGNFDFQSVTKELGLTKAPSSRIAFQADIQISVAPFLLANQTEGKLLDHLEERLVAARPQIRGAVIDQLLKKPGFTSLPDSVQMQLVRSTTDAVIDGVRKAKAASISDKMDQLVIETSIQQIVIGVGKVSEDGETFIFLSAGKMKVNGGAAEDIHGESDLNSTLIARSRVGEQGSTADTFAVRAGVSRLTNIPWGGDARLTLEGYVFKNRLPFVSAGQYGGAVASMTDEQFAEHKRLWELDSALLKFIVETHYVDFYISFGSYDGKGALSYGVTYRITDKDEVFVMGYYGNRENMKEGEAVYYVRHWTPSWDTYLGYERSRELDDPTISSEGKFDQDEFKIGIRKQFKDRWIFNDPSLYVEGYLEKNHGLSHRESVPGARIGFSSKLGLKKKR